MNKIIKIMLMTLIIAIIAIFSLNYLHHGDVLYFLRPSLHEKIETITVHNDMDQDGINDIEDILQGARAEVENRTKYKSAYYEGGYPPEDEGVCTDVIWRALMNAGYDIKASIDKDIKLQSDDYPNIEKADPNIDFRRVENLFIYFEKYMKKYTTEIVPYDINNLEHWQGGDIVILKKPSHIAIVSDDRRKDGIPYVIHNGGPHPKEQDRLLTWYHGERIIGHYRIVN